jgi:hypothetical protein
VVGWQSGHEEGGGRLTQAATPAAGALHRGLSATTLAAGGHGAMGVESDILSSTGDSYGDLTTLNGDLMVNNCDLMVYNG